MSKYYVWIREVEDGKPIEVGHGPYSLSQARDFARIGSQFGEPRQVTRGTGGQRVRTYKGGKRTWPTVKKQLAGFQDSEIPKGFGSGTMANPKKDVGETLLKAAGVGAAVAALVAVIKGVTTQDGARQVGPVRLVSGIATGPTGYTITIGQEEKTLLAQALMGEVSESASRWQNAATKRGGAAVLWALLQLHMLWANGDGTVPLRNYTNFRDLIRGYVQPINPLWSTAGRGKCAQYPDRCTSDILARRRRIQAFTWATVPQAVRDLINDWVAGRVQNPIPGMVDYAKYHFDGEQVNIAGNNFGTLGWRNLV